MEIAWDTLRALHMSHLSINIASGDIFSAHLSLLLDMLSNLKQPITICIILQKCGEQIVWKIQVQEFHMGP